MPEPFLVIAIPTVVIVSAGFIIFSVLTFFEGRSERKKDLRPKGYFHPDSYYDNQYKSKWFSWLYNLGWRSVNKVKAKLTTDEIKARNKAKLEGKPKPVKHDPNDVIGEM